MYAVMFLNVDYLDHVYLRTYYKGLYGHADACDDANDVAQQEIKWNCCNERCGVRPGEGS
jgi:hypothetical protein